MEEVSQASFVKCKYSNHHQVCDMHWIQAILLRRWSPMSGYFRQVLYLQVLSDTY